MTRKGGERSICMTVSSNGTATLLASRAERKRILQAGAVTILSRLQLVSQKPLDCAAIRFDQMGLNRINSLVSVRLVGRAERSGMRALPPSDVLYIETKMRLTQI